MRPQYKGSQSEVLRQQKTREPWEVLAAGKYLTNMDLPLAWCEHSPPNYRGQQPGPAFLGPDNYLVPKRQITNRPRVIRARFEFVRRAHRREFTPCESANLGHIRARSKRKSKCPSASEAHPQC